MPHPAAFDLGLRCLPMSLLWDARLKWVKPQLKLMRTKHIPFCTDSHDLINVDWIIKLQLYISFHAGVVIANKIDLDQRRTISPKMGNDFAASNGLKYFECSAVSIHHHKCKFSNFPSTKKD